MGTTGRRGSDDEYTGVFGKHHCYSIAAITDGTANTIAFSEGATGRPSGSGKGVAISWNASNNALDGISDMWSTVPAGTQPPSTTLATFLQWCNTNYQGGTNLSRTKGFRWGWGETGISLFHTLVPPNSTQYPWSACRVDGCGGCNPDGAITNAQSYHSGGVNCLMTDGSVRFIKDSISWATWWSLGTKGNGETIDATSY